ncbi:uncharacterized protein [Diadema antillarum]|uniref:uncharacterized protein n=1 Tax=Diadema antillarum TaxID=105358 RepID=UPI003A84128A
MPRRRKTKVASRAKPKLPPDDEEIDMAEEERKAKLENFLRDFDLYVDAKVKEMRALCTDMCLAIRRTTNMHAMKLSKETKRMKQVDYFAMNSIAPAEIIKEITKSVDTMVSQTVEAKTSCREMSTSSKFKDGMDSQSTAESDSDCSQSSTTARRTTRKATGARKKKTATTATRASARKKTRAVLAETPANNDNTRQNIFHTPANMAALSAMTTPFITPKFDTSVKVTPASVRRAKEGELLVSLSGSPVEAKVSPKDPKSVQDIVENVENMFSEDKELNDVDKRNILMLQETLSRMLKDSS